MSSITIEGTSYAYTEQGTGPLVLFGHGLLASREMFAEQIAVLSSEFRCVSIDWPGHGESSAPEEGWTFEDLADDAAALVRALGEEQAVFAGLSQGGMIFMRTALQHPEMVRALILLDTSAGPENAEALPAYEQLAIAMRDGDEPTRSGAADAAQVVLYGETWRGEDPEGLAEEKALMLSHDRAGLYLACRAVFDRGDITDRLGAIDAPTLVICGEEDVATPPEQARTLAAGIPGAELVMIPRAGHHSPIENPAPVTEAIAGFLHRLA